MAHGGYGRRRLEERRPANARRAKGLGPDKRGKKVKSVSIKNQIRSTERLLRKVWRDLIRAIFLCKLCGGLRGFAGVRGLIEE